MSKDQRKRDKKRKKELAKKKRDSRLSISLAYSGTKYKIDKLAPIWKETETGVYDAFEITDHELLDRTVAAALEKLVKQMKAGTLPTLAELPALEYVVGQEEDLVIGCIRRRWDQYFEFRQRPPKDKLIGVLRSMLGDIENMRRPGSGSQSYIRYITKFLTQKLGVSTKMLSADSRPSPELEEDEPLRLEHR